MTDGPRQDSYDLFLGNFKPYEFTISSPFIDERPFLTQVLPTIFYSALTVLLATIFFPKNYFTSKKNLSFFLVSLLVVILSLKTIFQNGMQYVNWPKLVDVGFLESNTPYTNKGNKSETFKFVPSSKYVKPVSSKME